MTRARLGSIYVKWDICMTQWFLQTMHMDQDSFIMSMYFYIFSSVFLSIIWRRSFARRIIIFTFLRHTRIKIHLMYLSIINWMFEWCNDMRKNEDELRFIYYTVRYTRILQYCVIRKRFCYEDNYLPCFASKDDNKITQIHLYDAINASKFYC